MHLLPRDLSPLLGALASNYLLEASPLRRLLEEYGFVNIYNEIEYNPLLNQM
jgi:hypothetical protein